MRCIDSSDIPDTSNVAVTAQVAAANRNDAAVEQIVGRLSLEPHISAVAWQVDRTIPEAWARGSGVRQQATRIQTKLNSWNWPLVPGAVAILKNIPKGEKGDYILSSTQGAKPIRGIGKFYRTRLPREITAQSGTALSAPFTSHDLRRTVATRLGESLGVGGEQLIKKVLGHSDGSVTAIYNRYGYVKEMRAGLDAWARELTPESSPGRSRSVQRNHAN